MKKQCVDKNYNNNQLALYHFHQGTNFCAYDYLGAHLTKIKGKNGVIFRVWAPNATEVSVVGDFNCWETGKNPMKRISAFGVYELFVQNLKEFDLYKFAITTGKQTVLKIDPYAFYTETPPNCASKIYDLSGYNWQDSKYISNRTSCYNKPLNIYEVNLLSWKKHADGSCFSYLELKEHLVQYVVDMGYTHVEFMPVSEYPYEGSWGYQISNYFAISSRFGTPKEFMALIDEFHKNNIGVIIDWVPGHFPKDLFGLYMFDGTPCYESQNLFRREQKSWGTHAFDLKKKEVQSFLVSNACFLFNEFHIDGLRVDAVASMLYLDYDRKNGEWETNENGGNHNLDSIVFFKKLNSVIFNKFPYALMIAEESTAFPLVTKPADVGGLGFNFKWNMGWMNDVLSYLKCDPYFRASIHDKLTFSMMYAFSENFILPISHDEVVHGKKSLIDKMHGNIEDKFSTLRAFELYKFAHPGKKLNFMGNEFAQFKEWNYNEGLEFFMLKFPLHKKFNVFSKRINYIYKNNAPLYEIEDSWLGFKWLAVDEKEKNVLAFLRRDTCGNKLVAIFNFSGVDYLNFRLGVDKGKYKVLISSDQKAFGGQGRFKLKRTKTNKIKAHNSEHSIVIDLPKLSGAYLIEKV